MSIIVLRPTRQLFKLSPVDEPLGVRNFLNAGDLEPLTVLDGLHVTGRLLERFVVPAPGEGPTPEQQAKGFFDLRFLGRTEAGHSLRVKVTGDRDPGYGSTAKMLGQAAACLAQDTPASRHPGGFWTPATLFGDRLIERLRAHSGLEFAPIAD